MDIQPNQAYFSKEALGIMEMRSSDNARPILTGINISNGKVCCADGYVMGESLIEQGEGFPNCVLNATQILAAKPIPKDGGIVVTWENNTFIASGVHRVIVDKITGSFPEYSGLFASAAINPTEGYISLGLEVLESLIKAAKKADVGIIVLRARGIDKPVEFCSVTEVGAFKGLLMPMFINNPSSLRWGSQEYARINPLKSDGTTVTLSGAGKSVTMTGKEFDQAVNAIAKG